MNSSKFNLWRACFSFCHLDSFLSPEEKSWMKERIEALKFSAEELSVLVKDSQNPPDISELLPLITNATDKEFLVDQMKQVAMLDRHITPAEKAKIDRIQREVLVALNEEGDMEQGADGSYMARNNYSMVEEAARYIEKLN